MIVIIETDFIPAIRNNGLWDGNPLLSGYKNNLSAAKTNTKWRAKILFLFVGTIIMILSGEVRNRIICR